MTNFVLYNRVAAEDRPDPRMLPDGQLACCLAYIESRGWAAVAEYSGDTQGDAA